MREQHRPLTPIQRAALLVVRSRQERGDPGPTMDEIAGALGVCKARVVAVADALERKGAVVWPRALGRRMARMARAV